MNAGKEERLKYLMQIAMTWKVLAQLIESTLLCVRTWVRVLCVPFV